MKTRREALKMISLATGSVMLGSMVTGGVFAGTDNAVANGGGKVFPWPYVKLDPVACADRSYKAYHDGKRHCMYGSFMGIIGELAEKRELPTYLPVRDDGNRRWRRWRLGHALRCLERLNAGGVTSEQEPKTGCGRTVRLVRERASPRLSPCVCNNECCQLCFQIPPLPRIRIQVV